MAEQASGIHHFWLGDEDLGTLDERKITTTDALMIEVESGKLGEKLTLKRFFLGIQDMDARAMITLVWFLRFKQGHREDIRQVEFVLADLRGEDEPDPTTESSGESDVPTSELSPSSAI